MIREWDDWNSATNTILIKDPGTVRGTATEASETDALGVPGWDDRLWTKSIGRPKVWENINGSTGHRRRPIWFNFDDPCLPNCKRFLLMSILDIDYIYFHFTLVHVFWVILFAKGIDFEIFSHSYGGCKNIAKWMTGAINIHFERTNNLKGVFKAG